MIGALLLVLLVPCLEGADQGGGPVRVGERLRVTLELGHADQATFADGDPVWPWMLLRRQLEMETDGQRAVRAEWWLMALEPGELPPPALAVEWRSATGEVERAEPALPLTVKVLASEAGPHFAPLRRGSGGSPALRRWLGVGLVLLGLASGLLFVRRRRRPVAGVGATAAPSPSRMHELRHLLVVLGQEDADSREVAARAAETLARWLEEEHGLAARYLVPEERLAALDPRFSQEGLRRLQRGEAALQRARFASHRMLASELAAPIEGLVQVLEREESVDAG